MGSKTIFLTTGLIAVAAVMWGAESSSSAGDNEVVAQVHGMKMTMGDLERTSAAALFQARTNYYTAEHKAIEDAVDQFLLEEQAKKEGLTVTQLLDKYVNSKVAPDPSEDALHVYYEGLDTTETYEAVRSRIVDAIRQRRTAKVKLAYMQTLRQGPITIELAPPRAPISMKDVPVRGPAGASVTVVEFADYQCPYCQQLQPILDKIESEFKGKIAFAYKDFPLPMHPDAPKAAEAAHCAGAQGKYWEYHDAVFAKKQLDIPSLENYSSDLKLDTKAFASCLNKGDMAGVVNQMATEANALMISGTPTLFVNGRMITGNLSYEGLRSVIMEELSASGAAAPKTTAANFPSDRSASAAR